MTSFTEDGFRLIGEHFDETGRKRINNFIEDGTRIIFIVVIAPPLVRRAIVKMDLGSHPRSRLIFSPTLFLKGVVPAPPPPPPVTWVDFMEEWF